MPAALIERLGTEDAQQFTQLRLAAIHDIQARMPKDAPYVPVPAYYYSESSDKEDAMRRDFSAAEKLGLQVAWIDQVPILSRPNGMCAPSQPDMHAYGRRRALERSSTNLGLPHPWRSLFTKRRTSVWATQRKSR